MAAPVLGAQIPLSTFARTDPDVVGYGLGADASFVSTLIGVIGAFSLPLTSRLLTARGALISSALLVAAGYALWIPFHDTTTQALINMGVAGIGSGALVAALASTGSLSDPTEGHAPLSGYLTVWAVCSVAALFAAIALVAVPKTAFAD